MEFLVGLCKVSKHTLMLDADVMIDGAVKTFSDHVFGEEPVHTINHDEGSMELETVFVNSSDLLSRMYNDMRDGNRVMLCCGSSAMLKGIAQEVGKIIGAGSVGIYHADSDKQNELLDVNTNWLKYLFIGFTSTITCSLSFEGIIHRVYVIPCERTACPREMVQMIARARNIFTGQVIVQCNTDDIYPLSPDHHQLYEEKLDSLVKKRRYMMNTRSAEERVYVSSIKRKPTIHGLVYTPNILTKLAAWDMVEEYLKQSFWLKEFTRIITEKKFTWRMDQYKEVPKEGKTEDEGTKDYKNVLESKKMIQLMEAIKLDLTDACDLEDGTISDILRSKTLDTATEPELLIFRKYHAQKYFTNSLTGKEVIEFEKNRRAIVNLILRTRMDRVFRDKLYLNEEEMGHIPEFGKTDMYIISLLEECLLHFGIRNLFDTRSRLNFDTENPMVGRILGQIDRVSTTQNRSTGTKTRLNHYLEKYIGITIHTTRVRDPHLKKKVAVYTLQLLYPDWESKDTILGSEPWIRQKSEEYDRFKKIPLGSEYRFNSARRTIIGFCSKYFDLKEEEPTENPFAKFAYVPN